MRNKIKDAEMPKIIEGLEVETVGDILGDAPMQFLEVDDPLEMPRIAKTPNEPALGIHFGIEEQDYHRLGCFSNSYARLILASETLFWAGSWLNPDKEEKKAEHYTVGKGYHAMILEGHDAYTSRFYPSPDPAQFPNALQTADEIKQALEKLDMKPVTRVDVPGHEGKTKPAVKADFVAQLVKADPTAQVWDHIVAKAERIADGRSMISVADDRMIRVAARMIGQDPELQKAFRGGYPEVTLIWREPRQGVLMKARADYLKLKAVVDLKSFANQKGRSIRNAILRAMADNHSGLQPAVYLQGVDEVRKLVRQFGASAIHVHGDHDDSAIAERQEWAMKWASYDGQDRFLWIYQQKGAAPVTRGFYHPLSGTYHSVACNMITDAVRKFRTAAETYGSDLPWLDLAEIDELDESELPIWGLEI